jgi:hypothetical protein
MIAATSSEGCTAPVFAMTRSRKAHGSVYGLSRIGSGAISWTSWSTTVCDALRARAPMTAPTLAEALATGLAADPRFCDLLANVPLHLEHDVDIERVGAFKRVSHAAVVSMADAIDNALPGLGPRGALDFVPTLTRLLTATCVGLVGEATPSRPTTR